MHSILQADKNFFIFINDHMHNSFFDWLMPLIRNSITWIPLYLFLLVFLFTNFTKNKWLWILYAAGTAIISDFVSSGLIKKNFFRLRPCNDPEISSKINYLLSYKPQSSSFTSSHAFTHFALAAFFFYTLKKFAGKWSYLFYLWAFSIAFAQVYIGVHFPLDVVCGGIIGFVFGYLSAKSFNKGQSLM
jgi:membrane-associated phospholipid phosphatase